jgi:hypothetical protein
MIEWSLIERSKILRGKKALLGVCSKQKLYPLVRSRRKSETLRGYLILCFHE